MHVTTRLFAIFCTVCALSLSGGYPAGPLPAQAADPRIMKFTPIKFQIPKSQRVQLTNGMVVYLLEDHELPIVSVTAYVKTGAVYDPADKVGLASFTGAVLRSGGTKSTPPDQLDHDLEFMASAIESGVATDVGSVSCTTLTKNLEQTLTLFGQVLTEPAFDPARLELARKQSLESIRRQNDDPKELADRELKKALYQGSPLGWVPSVASVQAITREDLVSFWNRYYYPENVILAVSGDFDQKGIVARLEKLFAQWQNHPPSFPEVATPAVDKKGEVLFVQKEVNQSVIRMGELGIDKNNPDLYALRVLEFILGGGFTSRLTQEIRSNRGLAYNVFAFFDVGRRYRGTFVAETETKTESTAKVIELMNSIMNGMKKAEVTPQELALAKDSIVNSFIFGFARTDMVVNQQARLEYYGYPAGYLENYRDNIAKVTRADLLRVANKYLHPEFMKIVVVGDRKKLDASLSAFGGVRELTLDSVK